MAASTSDRRPVLAASLALVKGDRVLVAVRPRAPMAKLYSFPGGRVEWGERTQDAALRELREEVGLSARLIGLAGTIEAIQHAPGGDVLSHYHIEAYAGLWVDGEPTPGPEADDPRFVTMDELARLPTTEGLHDVAVKAISLARASQ